MLIHYSYNGPLELAGTSSDTLTFQVSKDIKIFTRCRVLSTLNGLYDPLGFAAPVIIQGKALLRDLTADSHDWDMPLPQEKEEIWEQFGNNLGTMKGLP